MTRREAETQSIAIEAWRGVAAWMVVYTHFWAFSGADWAPLRLAHSGVNLFFVVSGFVFAPYLFGRPLNSKAHAVRRFFRIYPAYLLALAVYMGLKVWQGQPPLYVAEHLTFLHVQSKEMAFYYNAPFWSLPAEVEFYIVLPLLAAIARLADYWWGEVGRAWLLVALLVVAAGLRWWLGGQSDGQAQNVAFITLHHLPGVLVEFGLGAAAWYVSNRSLSSYARSGLLMTGLLGWATLAIWFGHVGDTGVDASPLRGLVGALTAMCFALMVAATVRTPSLPEKAVGAGVTPSQTTANMARLGLSALAQWSGRLSYGTYLFHMAALQVAKTWGASWGWNLGGTMALAVALTLAISALVYWAWENPWRVFGRRWAAGLKR